MAKNKKKKKKKAEHTRVIIDLVRCKGCGLCVEICPKNVFTITGVAPGTGYSLVEPRGEENCTACTRCVIFCPDIAIEVKEPETVIKLKKSKQKK